MDFLYGHDRKHIYLEEPDMVDLLDSSEIFHTQLTSFPTPDDEGFENDWLNSFLDDPVLNDRMMTDAMQPPCIKSEHSYSISDNEPGSPLDLHNQEDMDSQLFSNASALDLTMKSISTSPVKCETSTSDTFFTTATTSPTASLTQQPTIIVTTSASADSATSSFFTSETFAFPTIQIKQEPADYLEQAHEQTVNLESIVLPPTPPGSSGSDSEGSQSPLRSASSSPIRQTSYRQSASIVDKTFTQPLFLSPISQSGVLILSEEEKRTLISEGYPIPSKLPLTKQEEKNLKKIRRKIKNKISAQESRRKKKEYLEALEKRVEAYNHENNDLKKKVESLENNNKSLLGQLQKLQSLVSKMPKAASTTSTGTALMVLVFCFAVFLGSMSPSSLNIGYSIKPPVMGFTHHRPNSLPHQEMETDSLAIHDSSNPYATPNLKSRMLMSVDQEDHCGDFHLIPWENSMSCPLAQTSTENSEKLPNSGIDLLGADIPAGGKTMPDTTVVMVVAASRENSSGAHDILGNTYPYQSVMPDVGLEHKEAIKFGRLQNMSAEMETA